MLRSTTIIFLVEGLFIPIEYHKVKFRPKENGRYNFYIGFNIYMEGNNELIVAKFSQKVIAKITK